MRCLYINLDAASERRAALEASFAQNRCANWDLVRIPALDSEFVRRRGVPGELKPGEKGCYLSHLAAIEVVAKLEEPALVVEDDAMFGPRSLPLIEASFDMANREFAWDLMFTDVGFCHPVVVAQLLLLRRKLALSRTIDLKPLKGYGFFATSAYVVNPLAAARVLDELRVERLDVPFDLACRRMVDLDKIKGVFTFPFLTTLSPVADGTSIVREHGDEPKGPGRSWNLLRRLLWVEGDAYDPAGEVLELWRGLAPRSQLIGAILAEAFENLAG
jgi:GR25 family glycosyltransferase involved in LPS biosynthesis